MKAAVDPVTRVQVEYLEARDRLAQWLTAAGVTHFMAFHPGAMLVVAVWRGDAALAERGASACLGDTMLRWHVREM